MFYFVWVTIALVTVITMSESLSEYSSLELKQYTGDDNSSIYIALAGQVFDVSESKSMYGKDGRYHVLAGKDATFALASMDMSERSFQIDDDAELTDEQVKSLNSWVQRFSTKYKVVGTYKSNYVKKLSDEPLIGDEASINSGSTETCPFAKAEKARNSNMTEEKDGNTERSKDEDDTPRCPLGFGRRKYDIADSLPDMSLETLKMHGDYAISHDIKQEMKANQDNNQPQMPRLISVYGKIYDVSSSDKFSSNGPLGSTVGHEASFVLASGILKDENLNRSLEGLSFEEHVRLEMYSDELKQSYSLVATLNHDDYEMIFGKKPLSNNSSLNLHELIENQDLEGIRALLSEDKGIAESICSRTGLSALHKAVEVGSLEIVELLLTSGANVDVEATLYDNDTPAKLAKRLNQDAIYKRLMNHVD